MLLKYEGKIPSINHIYLRGKNGVYLDKRAREFKEKLGWLAKQSGARPLSGRVELIFEWHSTKKCNGDLDNKLKLVQDSLNNITYVDDKQIMEIRARKVEYGLFDGLLIEVKELE
jgi:Holliday junction resolvase RusA-like endonuclease